MADHGQTEGGDRAPWTIKGMSVETREKAVRCARRRGISVAAWMANAVDDRANLEAGDQVLVPGQTEPPNGQTSLDLAALAALLKAIVAAQAAGVRGSRTAASHACAVASERLRALRGLPSLSGRLPPGQTIGPPDDWRMK
jgi:hypothetical protein